MKVLKGILIVLLILIGLVLAIPVFLPSEIAISAQTEIELAPELIFENLAVYQDREKWDPWLQMEPTAEVKIVPIEAYVGSTYEWSGEKIGSGKMRVDSVRYPDYIASSIWFGDMPDSSKVEWHFEKTDEGSLVTWKFINKGSFPFGRWMNIFMKGPLQSSFDNGLSNFKKYLSENPPMPGKLSEFTSTNLYEEP